MPNRIIKESICTSDSVDQLSWFEEVLFYRLIVNCDDFGRFDGRTAVIKNRLFPLKDNLTIKSVETAINKLASAGLVALYVFEGKPYLYLPTWNEHQTIRAKRSKYPDPENICKQMISDDCKCSRNPIQSNPNQNPNRNPIRARRLSLCLMLSGQFIPRKPGKKQPERLSRKSQRAHIPSWFPL